MAIVDLAKHARKHPTPLTDIALRQGISISYLEQIFHKLKRNTIVESVRGSNGGYHLCRPASAITVADVILSVNEPLQTTRCTPRSGKGCMPSGARCLVHGLWESLDTNIYTYLHSITIEDVCEQRLDQQKAFTMSPSKGGADDAGRLLRL
jgi:Rrf2 family iron-sulfur cluster assembly transcriptional regulator